MEKFTNKIKAWWKKRYKMDELGKLLGIAGIVLFILSFIFGGFLINYLAVLVSIFFLYRYFSSQHWNRVEENNKYLRYKKLYKLKYENRKDAKIYMCKRCGKFIRVPKKKGKIQITCPTCGAKMVKRT